MVREISKAQAMRGALEAVGDAEGPESIGASNGGVQFQMYGFGLLSLPVVGRPSWFSASRLIAHDVWSTCACGTGSSLT